jgi:hypothetical protein
MSKPMVHARSSAARWGGKPEDYVPIHDFLDCSKATHADVRHRALLHHSLGPFIAEEVFGYEIENSEGKKVSVRDIAEQHILEDLGFIPSPGDYLKEMTIQSWMAGTRRHAELKIVD